MKLNLLIICLLIILGMNICNFAKEEESVECNYERWDKAIIVENQICAVLSYRLPLSKCKTLGGTFAFKYLMSNIRLMTSDGQFKYGSGSYDCMRDIYARWVDKMPSRENENKFPKAWDSYKFSHFTVSAIGVDIVSLGFTTYEISNLSRTSRFKCHCIGGPNLTCSMQQKFDENGKPLFDENGGAILEPHKPSINSIVDYQIIATGEKKFELFILKDNQFLVWEYSQEEFGELKPIIKWEFQYAFKVDKTEPYKVSKIGDALYVLMKDSGIYKLDTKNAIENKPDAPTNVLLEFGEIDNKSQVLKWEGFKQKHIVENKVKAEKISKLVYDSIVVDKDHETAYFQAGDYFFEITDLDKCVKMPKPREGLETFEDKEADRMRAVLVAIDLLHRSPMKSPDYKTVMGSSNNTSENPDSVNNLSTNGSANGGSDDDESESAVNKKNGNAENTSGESSDASATSKKNSSNQNPKNPDENGNDDSSNKSSDNSDPEPANTSDGTNTIIYITTGVGLLILLTLIFILLVRKKRV